MLSKNKKHISRGTLIQRIIIISLWSFLAVIVLINRNKLSYDAIVNYCPDNTFTAAMLIISLLTLKGIVMMMNCDIIYAASAVMFSVPVSFTVNIIGSVIMLTIPYIIGRRGGQKVLDSLVEKYDWLSSLNNTTREHEFKLSFFLRVVGIMPCEPAGLYLGACKVRYDRFILGSLLGILPAMILFSIIGEYASKPTSPQFIAAASAQLVIILISVSISFISRAKNK